jgi:hypothetical protein
MRELNKLKKISNGRLNEIKLKANSEAKALMKVISLQSKLTPYSECINPRLKNFTDKLYVKETCYHLYGENKEEKCKLKSEFCHMCCDYHVGSKFFVQRNLCKTQCTNLINGRDINEGNKKKLNKISKNKRKVKGNKKSKGKN